MLGVAHEVGSITVLPLAKDGDGELAANVAPHHENVGLIMLRRVEKLTKNALGAVEIGGKEETRQFLAGLGGRTPAKQRHASGPLSKLLEVLVARALNPPILHRSGLRR